MAKIILDVPDELSEKLAEVGDALRQAAARLRLPEILALSLQQPPLPARIYQYIVDFLACYPTPEQILAFRPTLEMQERLRTLLRRSHNGELTSIEQREL